MGQGGADGDVADLALLLHILHDGDEVFGLDEVGGGVVHLPDVDVVGFHAREAEFNVGHEAIASPDV